MKNLQLPRELGWIDNLPQRYKIVRLSSVVTQVKQKNFSNVNENLLSLSYGKIISKDIAAADGLLPESFETYNIIEPGDVVFRLTDLQNDKRSLRTGLTTEKGIITSAYVSVRPSGIEPRYLAYFMRAMDLAKVFYSLGGGLRQSLNYADAKLLPVVLPPKGEQRAIADYLDREISEIDSFVADCSRMVELIEEKESAFTASLLTHGLTDSDSVAEDHGIPWLENESIPTHWHRMKLGFLLRMKSGDAISSEAVQEEGLYPVFGGGGLRGYTSTSNITGIHVLIGRQGALCGKVFVSQEEAFATEHAIVTYPKIMLDLRWLESLLRFMNLGQYSQSAAQPGIGVETLSKLYVPVPPLSEQVEIGDSIAKHQESRSDLLLELESAIALAHERRAALISAAVTGQIDVSSQGLSPASQLRNELEVHV